MTDEDRQNIGAVDMNATKYGYVAETVVPHLKEATKAINAAVKKEEYHLLQKAYGELANAKEVLGTRMRELEAEMR
jgi:hypothetical protein